ncbi:MAG: hypothetical protein K6T73_11455 [Candidatus Bathyarchaeota archaeon]|nr:hypothetical protein [Candidatus Bathyarchaeota archaeon]
MSEALKKAPDKCLAALWEFLESNIRELGYAKGFGEDEYAARVEEYGTTAPELVLDKISDMEKLYRACKDLPQIKKAYEDGRSEGREERRELLEGY